MHYQEFVGRVSERIHPEYPGEAEYAIQATLSTLGEHLSGPEAEFLAARLPAELEAQLASGNYAEAAKDLLPEEFYRRVAARAGTPSAGSDGDRPEASTDAVLAVLSEAVGGAESAEAPQQPTRAAAPLPNNVRSAR